MRIQRTMVGGRLTTDYILLYVVPRHIRGETEVLRLFEEIEELIEGHKIKLLVLNCGRLHSATSAFFGKLVRLSELCKKHNIKFHLCCLQDAVKEGFKVLKLHKLLKVYDTEAEALG